MIYGRGSIAAATGAVVLLVGAVPLLVLLIGGRDWEFMPRAVIIIAYAFGGTLLGGMIGLWILSKVDWRLLRNRQWVWCVVGLLLGLGMFAAKPWPYPAFAIPVLGLIGAASATLYWFLDRASS